jgi:hypothetical protein
MGDSEKKRRNVEERPHQPDPDQAASGRLIADLLQ